MADLDTRSKRASSVSVLSPWSLAPVLPDGSFDVYDRQHIAWTYSGISTAASVANLSPLAGHIAWTGGLPVTKNIIKLSPAAGAILWTGGLPTVTARVVANLAPLAGAITWSGGLPTQKLVIKVSPAAGTITWTGALPTLAFPGAFRWTAVSRDTQTWTPVSRAAGSWTTLPRNLNYDVYIDPDYIDDYYTVDYAAGIVLWTKREFPYDDEV